VMIRAGATQSPPVLVRESRLAVGDARLSSAGQAKWNDILPGWANHA
jgi:hypothetical protein